MGNEYRAKVFKSGNSVALRLPKGIGLVEGDDVVLVAHDDGAFSFWRERDGIHALMSLYGAMSPWPAVAATSSRRSGTGPAAAIPSKPPDVSA